MGKWTSGQKGHVDKTDKWTKQTSEQNRVRENFVPDFVWWRWGSLSDILGFRQSFYTENGRKIWLLCWTFCLINWTEWTKRTDRQKWQERKKDTWYRKKERKRKYFYFFLSLFIYIISFFLSFFLSYISIHFKIQARILKVSRWGFGYIHTTPTTPKIKNLPLLTTSYPDSPRLSTASCAILSPDAISTPILKNITHQAVDLILWVNQIMQHINVTGSVVRIKSMFEFPL